jgi:hypothetical protein
MPTRHSNGRVLFTDGRQSAAVEIHLSAAPGSPPPGGLVASTRVAAPMRRQRHDVGVDIFPRAAGQIVVSDVWKVCRVFDVAGLAAAIPPQRRSTTRGPPPPTTKTRVVTPSRPTSLEITTRRSNVPQPMLRRALHEAGRRKEISVIRPATRLSQSSAPRPVLPDIGNLWRLELCVPALSGSA